jgi:hypothetical protein
MDKEYLLNNFKALECLNSDETGYHLNLVNTKKKIQTALGQLDDVVGIRIRAIPL